MAWKHGEYGSSLDLTFGSLGVTQITKVAQKHIGKYVAEIELSIGSKRFKFTKRGVFENRQECLIKAEAQLRECIGLWYEEVNRPFSKS